MTARGKSPRTQRELKLKNGRARAATAYEPSGRAGSNASNASSKGLDAAIKTEVDKVDKAQQKATVLPALSNLKQLDLPRVAKLHGITLPDSEHTTVERPRA